MMRVKTVFALSAALFLAVGTGLLMGSQDQQKAKDKKNAASSSSQRDTIAKPLTPKEQRKRDEKLRKELETPYRKWLDEDVAYIITDDERKAFVNLETDEERDNFIEQFWLRRDPTPDTEENEYKEEHYRRIAYANDHFASGIPGWKTDRGRIYIMYGAPDEIDAHPSGGTYERPYEEGGGSTSTYPFEDWRYRYIDGIGNNVILEFVDTTMTGEYHLTIDPSEKDALLYVPGAGLTLNEQLGLSTKTDRFTRTDGTHLGTGDTPLPESMDEFERLKLYANIFKPPPVKFKDLEAMVDTTIRYNLLPMQVRVDYIPLTGSTVLAAITLEFERKDLQFKDKDGMLTATVDIYGRLTTLSRRPLTPFEDTVTVGPIPTEMLQQAVKGASIYQKVVPVAPGRYRLNIVAKDVTAGNVNNYEVALTVPELADDALSASSLILADQIEKVPTSNIGLGQFVIGDSKIRPRVGDTFNRETDDNLGIYIQLYNFKPDETTKQPNGTVEYEILKAGTDQKVFDYTEDVSTILKEDGHAGASSQVTIEKLLPLKALEPGHYELRLKVTDKNRNQTLTPTATFTVT